MKKILLLGSGELAKELSISAKRYGCQVIACDKYANAPAMQVADEFRILDMLDPKELKQLIEDVNPDLIVPEIEAIRTEELISIEKKGKIVVPSAKAVNLTMNRDSIRERAKKLNVVTARYDYASDINKLKEVISKIGCPCIVKPVMSSSGKGQMMINNINEAEVAWENAVSNMRGDRIKVIVEEYINFRSEITLLTIRQKNAETLFCSPIGHIQEKGDYIESWQPAIIKESLLIEARNIAQRITEDLGGYGLFGVEFFVMEDKVIFSELSPRPHDTGMVTMFSQDLSQFDLHLRAILQLPIPNILTLRKGYSTVIKASDEIKKGKKYRIKGLEKSLKINNVDFRLFGKPEAWAGRRLGIILSSDRENGQAAKNFISIVEDIDD